MEIVHSLQGPAVVYEIAKHKIVMTPFIGPCNACLNETFIQFTIIYSARFFSKTVARRRYANTWYRTITNGYNEALIIVTMF